MHACLDLLDKIPLRLGLELGLVATAALWGTVIVAVLHADAARRDELAALLESYRDSARG